MKCPIKSINYRTHIVTPSTTLAQASLLPGPACRRARHRAQQVTWVISASTTTLRGQQCHYPVRAGHLSEVTEPAERGKGASEPDPPALSSMPPSLLKIADRICFHLRN